MAGIDTNKQVKERSVTASTKAEKEQRTSRSERLRIDFEEVSTSRNRTKTPVDAYVRRREMKSTVPDDTCISDTGGRPMSPFCEALDSDACNCVLTAVLEDIEVATVQRLTLPYIESAGDDVQDTAVNGEEDAVYVVY